MVCRVVCNGSHLHDNLKVVILHQATCRTELVCPTVIIRGREDHHLARYLRSLNRNIFLSRYDLTADHTRHPNV